MRRMVKVDQIGGLSGLGWLVPVVAGLGAAIGAFLYWCVMMVRKVGILVMVTLAVFASAGGGWEVARRWRKGWIEATATLVVSKLLMTVIFVLGIAAMGKTEAKDGIAALADVMSGIVIMVLVLLCPYATFKFVHWAARGHGRRDAAPLRRRRRADGPASTPNAPAARPPQRQRPPEPAVPLPERAPRPKARTRAGRLPGRRRRQPHRRSGDGKQGRRLRNGVSPGAERSRAVRTRRYSPRRPARATTPAVKWAAARAGRIRRECRVRPGRRMAVRSADHDSAAAGRTPVLRLTERHVKRIGLSAAASDRPLIPCPPTGAGRALHVPPGFHPRLQDPPLD
ncbi:hypothetical protein [Streptomyces stelliscabiei]|uniref:hypothetical protein n=1 Tax=Streptomyces stelliscabiei TaxID=146820 RepID=UPI003A9583C6